jgi:hypothetical protein
MTEGVSGHSLAKCNEGTIGFIEKYRSYYLSFLRVLLERGHNVWTISCSWHAVSIFNYYYESPFQKVPESKGLTMQEAIYNFVFEKSKVIQIDTDPWP